GARRVPAMPHPTEPRAENCTHQYDDGALQPGDPTAVIPWPDAEARLSAARLFWLATIDPDGSPHVRPVFATWVDGMLCTTSNPSARKGRNLAADGRCSASTSTDEVDFVVEGTAAPVTDPDLVERIFDAYRAKYGWPAAVVEGGYDAPFGAPTAGAPPYRPYALTPRTVYGIGTSDELAPRSTRWRFDG
ncbi:MAG TPA: pyridoxamine 5'-phosphate oxidase family protein, partial [Acidimicrobiales bacterium]